MATHEFGIMQHAPRTGERYDRYEPKKYRCISVDDDALESVAAALAHVDFYWHTLDVSGKGLAYCGITLIPPASQRELIEIIQTRLALAALKDLAEQALREKRWLIHFGL